MGLLDLPSLFNKKRFKSLSGLSMMLFMLYFPVGFVVVIFRCLISVQYLLIMIVLPKAFFARRFLMWFYFAMMGMFVSSGGKKNKKDKVNILVSNHISYIDSLAIECVLPSWRLQNHTKLPSWLSWLFGFKNPEIPWMEEVKTLDANVGAFPFAFFLEEETTSGKSGLLKFNPAPLKMTLGFVQPVVILNSRPSFMPIYVNYIHSTFWSDLFWMLFVPVTMFHICYLPAREVPQNEEDAEEFITNLEKDIAFVLAIQPTKFTAYEKKEYIKRIIHEERIRQEQVVISTPTPNTPSRTSRRNQDQLQKMIEQVKSVMPQVPIDVVSDDLKKTKDVDKTITNLLDGSVDYTPLTDEGLRKEQVKEKEKLKEIPSTTHTSSQSSCTVSPAKTTYASVKNRSLPFAERKKIMIEEARRLYLERHPEYR